MMRNKMAAAKLLACLGCGIQCTASGSVEEELVSADRGIWDAIAGAHPDLQRVNAALAPDYMDIDGGVRHPREEVIQYLQTLSNFSFQYERAKAFVLSPEAGYVVAEINYSSVDKGTPSKGRVLTTTVYSKERGRWMAHLHTEMEIKPETK